METDDDRDHRIEREIVADADTPTEQAAAWQAYLRDTLEFPFEARCTVERQSSPLDEGERLRVVGLSSLEPSLTQMFVTVVSGGREFAVPLSQLEPVEAESDTEEAVADWHYWLER